MRHQRELWRRVERALTGETLGRTVAGLVLAEVDRWALGRPRLWTDVELDALKAGVVRDSRARGVYVRAILAGCQARGIEPPPLDVLDPPSDIEIQLHIRWYLISRLMDYERGHSEILPVENLQNAWCDHKRWMQTEAAAGREYRALPQATFLQAYPDEFDSLRKHIVAAPRSRQYRQAEQAAAG